MSQSPTSHGATRSRYDMKRERDIRLHYGAAFRNIPHVEDLATHVPHPSRDSTLTALCQLTAIRMGAQRAMISLLDVERQHILAEATRDLCLRPENLTAGQNALWVGSVSIPRHLGLCENVLGPSLENHILVINDLAKDGRSLQLGPDHDYSDMRFYASVALMSPDGTIVGTLCIFDQEPRSGLTSDQSSLFEDLASVVIDYLITYTTRDQYSRGERFTRGLMSFAEGANALLPFKQNEQQTLSITPQSSANPSPVAGEDPPFTQDEDEREVESSHPPRQITTTTKSARHRSIGTLQDSILPVESKSMFSRAANVMMTSSNLDGVLILDASIAANRGQRRGNATSKTRNAADSLSESYQSRSSSDGGSTNSTEDDSHSKSALKSKTCQLLGAATSDKKGVDTYGELLEYDLARMLHEYPRGKIFTLTTGGIFVSSTDETTSSPHVTEQLPRMTPSKRQTKNWSKRCSEAIGKMFPDAFSVAFVPFWDFERSRWFAGCLCWSNDPYRLLSPSVDLVYFKIFSNSIMRELSRLDALSLDQVKSAFVASISHELRSPLHGILGTLEFVKDTPLDSFQASMLNSLHGCGTTLLDTINQVMDYGRISATRNSISSKRIKNENTVKLSSKPFRAGRRKDPAFDIAIATEQVVEAVFSGSSYVPAMSKHTEDPVSSAHADSASASKRNTRFIILDVADEDDWAFSFPIGSWRRIVMNLFGNAVKYTESGYIHISLRSSKSSENTNAPAAITLTITDTGLGISPSFLANRIFEPFTQENSHSVGTGLGLSIIRQIIDTSGGKIEVSSQPSVGTKVTVKLAFTQPESPGLLAAERNRLQSSLSRLWGRRICILSKKVASLPDSSDGQQVKDGLLRFTNTLANTLEKHLKMEVVRSTDWQYNGADIIICPEVSFECLENIRRHRARDERAPVIVFIGMDAFESATLRSDIRVTCKESVVEILTQPCGPQKLAFVLNRCLDRYDQPGDNVQPRRTPSPLPPVVSYETQQHDIASSAPSSVGLDAQTTASVSAEQSELPSLRFTTPPIAGPSSGEDSSIPQILIVDDNALNRRLLVAFMKKNGLQYQEASNGLEALQTYQAATYNIRMIIMDMSMPVMDGMTATRAIREHEQHNNLSRSCIIALTGLTSSSARLEAWSSGIDHYITKPVNYKELRELLKSEDRKHRERKNTNMSEETQEEVS